MPRDLGADVRLEVLPPGLQDSQRDLPVWASSLLGIRLRPTVGGLRLALCRLSPVSSGCITMSFGFLQVRVSDRPDDFVTA